MYIRPGTFFLESVICILVVGLHEKIKNGIHFSRFLGKYLMDAIYEMKY
jgi:hypothetical protein